MPKFTEILTHSLAVKLIYALHSTFPAPVTVYESKQTTFFAHIAADKVTRKDSTFSHSCPSPTK